MDLEFERVIRQALTDTRTSGLGYLGETQAAVQAVLRVRAGTTALAAMAAVNLVRKS